MFAMLVMAKEFQTNMLFVLALNNQHYLLMPSCVVIWHPVPCCIGQYLLATLYCTRFFLFLELVIYAE